MAQRKVALDGSSAPLVAGAPVLLATVPFSSFTANATYYAVLTSKLSRNARQRTFILVNTMNQPTSAAPTLFPYDSATQSNTKTSSYTFSGALAAGQQITDTSDNGSQAGAGLLASHVDSANIGMAMGATAPTSGNVYIYVVELL